MTRLCSKCGWPMMVIKATVGVIGWQPHTHKRFNKPADPILLYKCPKCGALENGYSMHIEVIDGR